MPAENTRMTKKLHYNMLRLFLVFRSLGEKVREKMRSIEREKVRPLRIK